MDLSKVSRITCDAIAGLLATMHDSASFGAEVEGNTPEHGDPRSVLSQSGFWDFVKTSGNTQHRSSFGKVRRFPRSRDTFQIRYNQEVASELCEFAIEKLTGTAGPHGPSYSALGEAMLNTLNHASNSEKPQPWWASVYFDPGRRTACFTFIDQGVGIFKSQRLATALKVLETLRLLSHADLLQRILRGEIRSSTGIPGRGNGLPGMFNHCKAGRIRNLTILANDAIGNAETETFLSLRDSFRGTLLYWEVVV